MFSPLFVDWIKSLTETDEKDEGHTTNNSQEDVHEKDS